MKKFLKHCGYVLTISVGFFITYCLFDLITGNNIKETDWLHRIISSLLFGVALLLVNIFIEKKNLK